MGFRFRKSVKIAPGIRVNFSKSGVSTSVGRRGATVNFSKRGTRVTAGIPGTGLSASKLYKAAPARPKTPPTKDDVIVSVVLGMLISGVVVFAASGAARFIAVLVFIGCVIILWSQRAKRPPPPPVILGPIGTQAPRSTSQETPSSSWQERADAVGALVHPGQSTPTARATTTPVTLGELRMQAGLQANVDGVPTYKLASQKDSLEVMAACAEAEANTYWAQPLGERQCAAPFYFERAAILYRKAKQHDDEVRICESWIAIDEDFANQTAALAGGTPSMPRSQAIHARIGKARSLRDKARQSAGSVATATSVNAQAAAVTPPSSPTEKS